jgi:hypothetical protein
MKKMAFCIAPLIIVFMGCASRGTAVAEANSSSPGMDMDVAIREAAMQMETKIPSKTMVALVSVASPSTAFSTQVLTRLESAIVSSGKLVVVDRANLDKIREEQGFQLSGEVDDESAKSIGKLLGAGAIVTGSLADLGDVYSLTLKAINIETATVAVSYLADLAKSTRIETLLASGGGGAVTGVHVTQVSRPSATSTSAMVNSVMQAPAAPEPVQRNPNDPYKIGETGPAGGIVFYDKGSNNGGWRYLEAAPYVVEFQSIWGLRGINIGSLQSVVGSGKRNTGLIIESAKREGIEETAAQQCDTLEINGFDDWFMPSQAELDQMYRNLRQKTLGNFQNNNYWSSTSPSVHSATSQNFKDGSVSSVGYLRDNVLYVRAIRQF